MQRCERVSLPARFRNGAPSFDCRHWLGWSSSKKGRTRLVLLEKMLEKTKKCSKNPRTRTAKTADLVVRQRKNGLDWSRA